MTRTGANALSRRMVLGGLGATVALGAMACSDDGDAGEDDREARRRDPEVIRYGEAELQRAALSRPRGPGDNTVPVVVLVHGGFWQPGFDRTLMDPLAESVVAEGWAAWNVDYRPSGDDGGWPITFTDIAAAVDHLAEFGGGRGIDVERVAVVGHSAGGTLALWAAARSGLPADAPGAGPRVEPTGVVSLAGVPNLAAAALEGVGGGAVDRLMGGSPTGGAGADYGLASPVERLPLGVRQLLVHGTDDAQVPIEQSRSYRDRARDAGDTIDAELLDGVDHFEVIDPASQAWRLVLDWLADGFA